MIQIMQDAFKVSTLNSNLFKSLPSSEFHNVNSRLYTSLHCLFTIRIIETDRKT